ncbi:MAG: class I SAM-dependent methyltransferase [Gammaproteobacteria bacterium]|nr:class I SAM-dependent methyltransferase [Gammaproteobacteria bacterium]
MMGLYQNYVLPWAINLLMSEDEMARLRQRVVPSARGRVLEVGIGRGLNLPYYGAGVDAVVGVDPMADKLRIAGEAAAGVAFPVELLDLSAEALPFEDEGFDSVVMTWTLCSIVNAPRALAEIRRVLKPSGELIFLEHGLAPEASVAAWQRRLNPLWRRCVGGCNLDRATETLIRGAGFALSRLETGYLMPGPRPLTYHYEGRAAP